MGRPQHLDANADALLTAASLSSAVTVVAAAGAAAVAAEAIKELGAAKFPSAAPPIFKNWRRSISIASTFPYIALG
jgi:hypothetical protein